MGKRKQEISLEEAVNMLQKSKKIPSITGLFSWLTANIVTASLIIGLTALAVTFVVWTIKNLIGVLS